MTEAHNTDMAWLATCTHEAAHAVIAMHFGWDFQGAQVGRTQIDGGATEPFGGVHVRRPHESTGDPSEDALIAAAGGLAEAWVSSGHASHDDIASDHEKVAAFARSVGGDIGAVISRVRAEAQSLVNDHRCTIQTLARELDARQGRIAKHEIGQVRVKLGPTLPPCCPRAV